MSRVFLTGGSGFLGSRLLGVLRARGTGVTVLDRSGSVMPSKEVQVIRGNILNPEGYRPALEQADVVVHLAALTGRASARDHFTINAQGTETLLNECRLAGVSRVLFVSSIAVAFPDKSNYYYAQAKQRAEDAVRQSGLAFTIIRPTIILGPQSPILVALEKLASLPVIPIFGTGRVMVQPIYVDDVADFIAAILAEDMFRGETLELGGPVQLSMEEFMQQIRRSRRGQAGPVLHLPLGLIVPALRAVEALGLGGLLPMSVGQLSPFRFNSTIQSNRLHEGRRGVLRDVSQMLALSMVA